MAPIGQKQYGDTLSVPVENSILKSKRAKPQIQATTISPPGSAGLFFFFFLRAAVEELSPGNGKLRLRECEEEREDFPQWWSELTGGGS